MRKQKVKVDKKAYTPFCTFALIDIEVQTIKFGPQWEGIPKVRINTHCKRYGRGEKEFQINRDELV